MMSSLRIDKDSGRTKRFFQAVKTATKASKVEETKDRLQWIRDELQFRILVSIKSSIDPNALRTSKELDALDTTTKTLVSAIIDGNQNLRTVIDDQAEANIRSLAKFEASAQNRHEKTLTEIQNLYVKIDQSWRTAATTALDPDSVFQSLTRLLNYDQKDDRYEDISPAYQSTFEWIYTSKQRLGTTTVQWDAFNTWLREESGIYWISAKAGAGKSTLMKFILQDDRTKKALQEWASGTPVLYLSFFFWNLGTDLQKSTRGLYQSLLHQALNHYKDLGPVLFPEQYKADARWETFPSPRQLRKAFQRLLAQKDVPLKLFLLIDGLDEFEDAEDSLNELAEILTLAVKLSSAKAVLSSRPHQAFVHAFAHCPRLELHDLTRPDIMKYINGKLKTHPRMVTLCSHSPQETDKLIIEIAKSASGVFLWVKLVVRSLLEGLQNYDTLPDLHARLVKLPKDLEQLFDHMLSKVPSEYWQQRSELFQILRLNQGFVSRDTLERFFSAPSLPLTAVDIFGATLTAEDIINHAAQPMDDREAKQKIQEIEGRLRSRTAGLIELQSAASLEEDDLPDSQRATLVNNPSVQYLHKSIAEWLYKSEVWSKVLNETKETAFDVNVSLMKAMVMRIKLSKSLSPTLYGPGNSAIWALIRRAFYFAKQAELSSAIPQEALIDEIDRVLTEKFNETNDEPGPRCNGWCDTIEEDYYRPAPWHDNVLAFAVRGGLELYVAAKFKKHGMSLISKKGRPLLDYACRPEPGYSGWINAIDPKIVDILLRNGSDPNEKFNGFTPWQNTLYKPNGIEGARLLQIVLLLLQNGADVNAYVERDIKLGKRRFQKRRYSMMYVLLEFGLRATEGENTDPARQKLAEAVLKIMRDRKAPVYVSHRTYTETGVEVWEEQILTKDQAPFLSNDDRKSMRRRAKLNGAKVKRSRLPMLFGKLTDYF